MELQGVARRAVQVGIVLVATVPVYIAWHKVAIERQEYGAVIIAVIAVAFAARVILGWLGIVSDMRIEIEGFKPKQGGKR